MRCAVALSLLAALFSLPARGESGEVETLSAAIAASDLNTGSAVAVEGLRLETGMAVLKVERGTFFPVTPVAGRVAEAVLVGDARLLLEPPDDVEAGQLELFTGGTTLDERVSAAVLVIASDAAAEAIFGRPLSTPEPAAAARAEEIFAAWKRSPLRKLLNVEGALLQDAIGDALYQRYFAGWFHGEELGELVYLVEPESREQVTLGQFVPADLSEKEKRRAARRLHKEKRRGRLMGLEVEDLGTWDTWVSASLVDGDGNPVPGTPAFEPQRYELELELSGRKLELSGRARLHLQATTGGTRGVRLRLNPDLVVSAIAERGAGDLPFVQTGDDLLAVLPRPPAAGEEMVVEVTYGGRIIDKLDTGNFALRDTVFWHPHAGEVDRAPYDVTLRWPRRLDLVAAGRRVDGGEGEGRTLWERRVIEQPAAAFGFEVGKFSTASRRVGDVTVHVALSPTPYRAQSEIKERLLDDVSGALSYFEEVFGPYPADELTVVTTHRFYSQSLFGFMTLSRWMLGELGWLARALGFEDPRTVVAHEVAHQWWGHAVGWESYRDQWISEAMASYAAVLYARNRLGDVDRRFSPSAGWEAALTAALADGRPVEAAGPLVAGERLLSSRSEGAYFPIVYKKGALVVEMLARNFGEESFLTMLRRVVEVVDHRAVSTGTFFALLERLSGQELDAFTRQYVFGTGLPEVYYDYRFEEADGGAWRIEGVARQRTPYHYRYRVVRREGGGFDIERERVDHLETDSSALVVPFEAALYDPAREGEGKRRRGDPDPAEVGNVLLQGRLWLEGDTTEFSFEVDHEPKELWLDRHKEVFGRFFNQRRHPKRVLYLQCRDLAADGLVEEARLRCQEALAAEHVSGPAYGEAGDDADRQARGLDGRIHASLSRLYLAGGDTAAARAALERAEDLLEPRKRRWYRGYLTTLEARLALREGNFHRAYKLLRKGVLKREETDSTEALLLLAIAARATGHGDDLEVAVDRARDQGADVSLLESR